MPLVSLTLRRNNVKYFRCCRSTSHQISSKIVEFKIVEGEYFLSQNHVIYVIGRCPQQVCLE